MDEYGNLQDWVARTSGQAGGGSSGVGVGSGVSGAGGIGGASGISGGGGGGSNRRRVVYGSTDLLNAPEFLEEALARLGNEN